MSGRNPSLRQALRDVVTVVRYVGRVTRAEVVQSYRKRFIVKVEDVTRAAGGMTVTFSQTFSYERNEERLTWVRDWDTVDAIAFRAEKALASCR